MKQLTQIKIFLYVLLSQITIEITKPLGSERKEAVGDGQDMKCRN